MVFKGALDRDGSQLWHMHIRLPRLAHSRRGSRHTHDERRVHRPGYTQAPAEQEPRIDRETSRHIHHGHLRRFHANHRVRHRVRLQVHAQDELERDRDE